MVRFQRFRGSFAAIAVLLLLAIGAPVESAASERCVGRPNVIELTGVVGEKQPKAVGQIQLVVAERTIPFSVLQGRRLGGPTENAIEILQRLGPGTPTLRVAGSDEAVAPLLQAKPGADLVIRGVLDDANRYLQLVAVGEEVPAPAGEPET